MIYFIATSSVFNNSPIRQFQYTTAISKLKLLLSSFPADYRLIIVENNGNRHTFLNELHDTVFYTYNNFLYQRRFIIAPIRCDYKFSGQYLKINPHMVRI